MAIDYADLLSLGDSWGSASLIFRNTSNRGCGSHGLFGLASEPVKQSGPAGFVELPSQIHNAASCRVMRHVHPTGDLPVCQVLAMKFEQPLFACT